jgi:hypothetical protein
VDKHAFDDFVHDVLPRKADHQIQYQRQNALHNTERQIQAKRMSKIETESERARERERERERKKKREKDIYIER